MSTDLNFDGDTEEAFEFCKSVFATYVIEGRIVRMIQALPMDGMPSPSEAEQNRVLNVQLPIAGGHILMGTDTLESFGPKLVMGNNVHITVHPDSREEAERHFAALGDGATVPMPMEDQVWATTSAR